MKPLSIVLADDHKLVRAGLKSFIVGFDSFTVVGEAGNGLEAIAQTERHQPDVLILDIAMPLMRGLEAIKDIKKISPATRVLILSMHNREDYVRSALQNGADGYILKESAADELLAALDHLSRDEIYLSPAVSRTIVEDWLQDEEKRQQPPSIRGELTDREKSVLKLVAEGLSNKKIAELLHISVKTVETHRFRMMEKLKLRNVPDVVKYAIRKGFVEI
ncbi:response regulator transcription factor [candidate division KSB1 bacterium]|nr:response regulator transcription factor [candidate division KSB1 bacterium]